MIVAQQTPSSQITDHALLVAYGRFAEQIGLIRAAKHVRFGMKTVIHSPADKVLELLNHSLAGGMHINPLNKNAHPLIHDDAVAHAWGQESLASASGVRALLHSVSTADGAAVRTALDHVIAPDRRRLLRTLSPASLVVHFDLTGVVVSDQATTYEGADFGHLGQGSGDAGVARGYQFARAQVAGEMDVFVLGGFLHPGRTVSTQCLAELVTLTSGVGDAASWRRPASKCWGGSGRTAGRRSVWRRMFRRSPSPLIAPGRASHCR